MLIKMSTMQIVFLFDLSVCSDFLLESKEELNKRLLSIRLACVRLLTDFSSKTSNFKWGFKFFDSSGSITQMMCKFAFSDVSLEAFETLENEICMRYERHIAILQALEVSEKSVLPADSNARIETIKSYPVNILQLALTQILCEFQWESMDMWSPSTRKFKDKSLITGKKNFVVLFSDFKDNDEILFNYFGLNSLPSKQKFINLFLPQALRESLLQKADIHLIFLNTCEDQKFMSTLSSSTLPLLSESLHSVQGSMIPLSVLSQPLYKMQFLNCSKNTLTGSQVSAIPELYSSYHNSLMPFSSVFHQSLYHVFYSKENNVTYECYVNIVNESIKIPIQVMNIYHNDFLCRKSTLNKDTKRKFSPSKKSTWSKFVIHSAVSRSFHYSTYEMILCLPDDSKSDESEIDFTKLNKSLYLKGVNLLLECVTDCGIKMPGLLSPLTSEAAVISILYPPVSHLLLNSGCKNLDTSSLKAQHIEQENNSCTIPILSEWKTSPKDTDSVEHAEFSSLKSFQMECMEPWFKPTSVSNLESHMQSRSLNKISKIKPFYKLLQQSARSSKKLSSKSSKKNFTTGNLESLEAGNIDVEEKLPDLSYEELLPAIKNIYDSVIEQSDSGITCSKRIVKLIMNYYKKQKTPSLEEDVQNFLKNNLIMTARGISEKYETLDTAEDIKKKVKECQIQVLLILEIENYKKCPDRPNCVSAVSSLLRLMVFYSGIEELQNFMHDVLLKNFSHQMYDVLVDIGDELSISIFDDAESTNSPADTVSSEVMNEDEIFSSTISSNISEKSSSSTCSRKDNGMERKLLRRRSDISDSASFRQVMLPRSSKKKKRKVAASKGIRCSPRIAVRNKEENARVHTEKPRTVCRNLFPGSGQTPKKNKNSQPSTPKSKKTRSNISKAKYVAETPSPKQSNSFLQRRKSFMDKMSDSPKVIAESPQIVKSVKEGANKEMLEKLQKARLNLMKTTVSTSQGSSRPTFTEYTPESKRRLSLKLFSKLLTSPTARMGIKKCTKRLFDQISPKKDGESNKKLQSDSECKQLSCTTLKRET